MPLTGVYLDPAPSEDLGGWTGEVDSFGTKKKGVILRESGKVPPYPEFESHDDTGVLTAARTTDRKPVRFLEANNPRFETGIKTDGKTSAKGRPDPSVAVVDGEHKTLLSIGRMNEALEDDNHAQHTLEHRMLLADPNLTETQRSALLDHIGDHGKKHRKRLKAVKETQEAQDQKSGYKRGLGMMSRAKTPLKDDVIPEDDPQSRERKRTAGMISMESKFRRFGRALKTAGRRNTFHRESLEGGPGSGPRKGQGKSSGTEKMTKAEKRTRAKKLADYDAIRNFARVGGDVKTASQHRRDKVN